MLNSVRAVISYGFLEYDMPDQKNPFINLRSKGSETRADALRLPLTDALINQMNEKLASNGNDDLNVIWKVLTNTGCRIAEVSGLLMDDVVLNVEAPYLIIKPNDVRGLKTKSSVRFVPLVGEALVAMKGAVKGNSKVVFKRYARERGADSVSAALMKNLRTLTPDKRMVIHSLRHSFKDKMRIAGVPKEVQDNILGHSSGSVGENTYGSQLAKLEVAHQWMSEVYKADNPDSDYA
jgi:integrase